MKNLCVLIVAALATASWSQTDADYHRNNVRLLKHIPLAELPGAPSAGSGCAGYVSPSGKEYAIMGQSNGNAVYNLTNPQVPTLVGHIPGPNSSWHEVCTLGQYAYACTEAGGGIQIIDLTQVDSGTVSLGNLYTNNSTLSRGHTVQAVPSKNMVVVHGGDVNGLRAYNCADPLNPTPAGNWMGKYVHDAVYHKYTSGPYAGKTVCFAFCGNGSNGGVYVLDMDNVGANGQFIQLGSLNYYQNAQGTGPTNFYSHSGSLSADERYVYANDELDEANGLTQSGRTITFIIDVQNLATPTKIGTFSNPINVIDHNSMIQDGFLMLSAYRAGMRVYNLANPTALTESGYFDTWPQMDSSQLGTDPEGSGYSFNGDWGVWANFPSGIAILSDINRGLFIVDPSEAKLLGAPITAVAFVGANSVGDGVTLLRKDDGQEFEAFARSGKGDMIVSFETSSLAKSKVDVRFRTRCVLEGSDKALVWIKNQVSGNWDLIGDWLLTASEAEYSILNLDGTQYVGPANTIDVKVGMRTTNTRGVKIFTDMLRAYVHN
jgi:choice-of-anchor B domain-containing protein